MGNQGTNNWKWSALFAVSLMLIAGVFGNAAMAADGDGNLKVTAPANAGSTEPMAAGAKAQTVTLTYTNYQLTDNAVTNLKNMAGGKVQITFPTGWKVSKKSISIWDKDRTGSNDDASLIYRTNANAEDSRPGSINEDIWKTNIARVAFTANEKVEITLSNSWNTARDLTLTFGDVEVPIPDSLRYITIPYTENDNTFDRNYAVKTYEFTTRTAGKDGILTRLKPTADVPDPQPYINVGNIASGSGKLTVKPAISYQSATDKVNFTLIFTATGPMYDVNLNPNETDGAGLDDSGDTDADIEFNIHDNLTTPNENAGTDGYIYVSGTRGSVRFETPSDPLTVVLDQQNPPQPTRRVIVNISRMDEGDEVHITYQNATNSYAGASPTPTVGDSESAFDPATRSTRGQISGFVNLVAKDASGGILHRAEGSGKVAISPSPVEAGATIRKITLTYTANVALADGSIRFTTAGIVTDDPDQTGDQTLSTTSGDYGYVASPDTTGNPTIADVTDPTTSINNTITWTNINLDKGKTFKMTIENVKASTAGAYTWGIADDHDGNSPQNLDADKKPVLFVLETVTDAVTLSADQASLEAGSEEAIVFTFTATKTPITGGYVRLQIPSSLSASGPTTTADKAGEVVQSSVAESDSNPVYGKTTFDTDKPGISGRWVTMNIKRMNVGDNATLTYKKATIADTAGTVKVNGYFRASKGSPERGAGIVEIDITNVKDGSGTATISAATPTGSPGQTVRAGSQDNAITVVFKATGAMDGGKVSLQIPDGWKDMQRDPTKRNYIEISASSGATLNEADYGPRVVIANLNKFGKGNTVTFTYGGGTGAEIGAQAQTNLGVTTFTIKSDGDGNGTFAPVNGIKQTDPDKAINEKALGQVYDSAKGDLKLEVIGGSDGQGTASVSIETSKAGDQDYPDPDNPGSTKSMKQVHAGDNGTYLKFTYEPIQTIEEGQLQLTVPGGWGAPQGGNSGVAGYTWVEAVAGADIKPATYSGQNVVVDINSIETGEKIVVHYGYNSTSPDGGAVAPGVAGASQFLISVKGTKTGSLGRIADLSNLVVNVLPQASGGGSAEITEGTADLRAGDTGRTLTIVYTAAGEIQDGMLKLTVPDKWSPTSEMHVDVASTGTIGEVTYGGDKASPTLDVEVAGVVLDAMGTVTFTYKDVMVQPTMATDVEFKVDFDGSADPRKYQAVGVATDGTLKVNVGEARPGSGSGMVTPPGVITAGSTGNKLTFTYTVAGHASYPREFRVKVPTGWSTPIKDDTAATKQGTYKVEHRRPIGDILKTLTTTVQKLNPVGMDMVARVKAAQMVEAKDQITFIYENATAPAAPERSMFQFFFDGAQVGSDHAVVVQSAAGASQLTLTADPAEFSRDAGATHTSTMLTVKMQDADGNPAAMASDTAVTLSSTSSTGMFDPASITLTAGSSEGTASYTDTTLGMATLTAAATGLTSGTATVEVTTDAITIDSASLDKTMAKVGDTVTVTAMGTAGLTTAMFSIGSVVTDASMTESAAAGGTYTGTYTPVADMHDGTHTVTVSLAEGVSLTAGAITVDTTAPTVSASASPMTVANGDTVTITAMVSDAGSGVSSVSADVSMLDTTQTAAIALTMMEDSYSGSFTIGAANAADNGMHTITVTAMDAAGNSAMASATVTLNNTLSYTATLPAGISLFHVPLMVDGLNTVNDLKAELGDAANLLITYDGTSWNSRSGGVAITSSLGILVSMGAETTVTFEGYAWSDGAINVAAGNNLVGLPLNDASVANVSDIIGLFDAGVVTGVIVASDGEFNLVTQAGDTGDGPVMGHAAYLVMASADGMATVTGDGWMNSATGAAPIALTGYTVDNQTPVLDVNGSVVDEITGVAQEGFRVKVKNLSTKAALSEITATEEAADGYNITFVDLNDAHAARVGDVLEISADSPNPLIGVKPVRYIVTVDDVKDSRIELEALIAYEIPAETELLRNYPNPFNPETWIPYRLSEDANVSLTIYDVNGELVRTIDIGHQSAAVYESRAKAIYWDGRNRFGEQVASGVYFYSLSAGDFSATRKMVILK